MGGVNPCKLSTKGAIKQVENAVGTTNTNLESIEADIENTNAILEAGIDVTHAGTLPKVEGSVQTLWNAQAISGDAQSSVFDGAANWEEFLVEIEIVDTGSGSDANYTLKNKTDDGSNYHTVKDKYGNDCTWASSLIAEATDVKLFEVSGYYQNLRIEVDTVTNSQTTTARIYPRK